MAATDYCIHAEILVTHDGKDGKAKPVIVFECDPLLNKECRKTFCFVNGGECRHVKNIAYAKRRPFFEERETTEKQGKKNGKAIKR